jgi:hypothetical protein
MNLGRALIDLHDAEAHLASELRKTGERHATEHDFFHLCRTLARQCEQHASKLQSFGPRYGVGLTARGDGGSGGGIGEFLRRRSAELNGHKPESGLEFLDDLRRLLLVAEDVSIQWVMVGQAAQAVRDPELLEAVTECHTETEIQVKWLTTRIKTAAPQALASGP